MNKTQLIECVAEEANVTKKVATETVEATLAVITKALKRGVNPKTGEAMIHPAKSYVSFKPSKNLKVED